ncbi:hypothetical protein NBRC116493_30320 [Aurantivibrio infirmus]
MYEVDGEKYEIEVAGLVGILDEDYGIRWAMDLYAKKKQTTKDFGGAYFQPKLSFTNLINADEYDRGLKYLHWHKAESYDRDIDDWIGDFYIFDAHHFNASIKLQRKQADSFLLKMEGQVNLVWENVEEVNYKNFTIEVLVPFYGFKCPDHDREEAKSELEKHFDMDDFFWLEEDNKYFSDQMFSTVGP